MGSKVQQSEKEVPNVTALQLQVIEGLRQLVEITHQLDEKKAEIAKLKSEIQRQRPRSKFG